MSVKVADQEADSNSKDSDAIWAEAREAVRDESDVVRRRVLGSYWHPSPEEH